MVRTYLVVPALVLTGTVFLLAATAEKPRIYIADTGTTEVTADNLQITKTASPQNIEVMKAFSKQCPSVTITGNREKADYIVRFYHEDLSPVTPFVKGNKVAVFSREDDLIFTDSSRLLNASVKSACAAIGSAAAKR